FGAPITLLNLNVGFMIGAFLALSAFFHLLVISPKFWPRYTAGLEQRRNTFRWVEYSVSSSLMIIVILQLNGVSDFVALGGIFFVNVSMILFGLLQERYATPGDGDLLPFWFGSLVGAVPWVAVLMMALSPKGPAGVAIPTFVWGIIVSLFVLFNCFALVQFKQYSGATSCSALSPSRFLRGRCSAAPWRREPLPADSSRSAPTHGVGSPNARRDIARSSTTSVASGWQQRHS
ncbi:MAG: hypothetical protein ACJA2F_001273, partial [Nitriliruptoraceae bacterium]